MHAKWGWGWIPWWNDIINKGSVLYSGPIKVKYKKFRSWSSGSLSFQPLISSFQKFPKQVSRLFQWSFKGLSRVFQRHLWFFFKVVSNKFWGYFIGVFKKFPSYVWVFLILFRNFLVASQLKAKRAKWGIVENFLTWLCWHTRNKCFVILFRTSEILIFEAIK